MKDLRDCTDWIAQTAAEGARLWGDDPSKIRRHMQSRLEALPVRDQRRIDETFRFSASATHNNFPV